ncbi:hypothetical protein AV530_015512 [Patagioenas fasciata monilis]|uniref:Uncharacterized protein n=1 Tax=Patagioenas fasciata monilis TaxID=372326 RepID=A0A1V4KRV7_PATFA|nr:hypothetical protein AV530_015512 [Patagioenas fasciata monilis]
MWRAEGWVAPGLIGDGPSHLAGWGVWLGRLRVRSNRREDFAVRNLVGCHSLKESLQDGLLAASSFYQGNTPSSRSGKLNISKLLILLK